MCARKQAKLPLKVRFGHGGARPGSGRKPKGPVAGVSHSARAEHKSRYPVHVTLRGREGLPSFRADGLISEALQHAIARGSRSGGGCRG